MISEIKENYRKYNEIYNEMCSGKKGDDLYKILLENSLYLSVFTTFEEFLKELIENYINNVDKQGIKFSDLSEGIALSYFLLLEKRIQSIFETSNVEKQKKAFNSYFSVIGKKLNKQELQKHIHFEFLHENKLNGYYRDLFEQLFNNRNFLDELKLKENIDGYEDLDVISVGEDANTFLKEYTSKIRNNIAHQNQKFVIKGYTFKTVTEIFLFIIESMISAYEKNTGFQFILEEKNILDDFS